ncbi:MAG: GNAT family N-acetyltransferase, partial [Eubacterium sp.]|nr:GNAT family N-acetyltransferase [Eubacterium sp.]
MKTNSVIIREFKKEDVSQMIVIWNEIVAEGNAFPQEELLNEKSGFDFFSSQTYTSVAELENRVVGLYILHPNNVGRCGHICNASYAVDSKCRGQHIGELLVRDCIRQGRIHNFKILQFNAVVESNASARHLYEKLGFIQLGVIKNGFRLKNNT